MNNDQQWVVDGFLDEIQTIKFTEEEPLYKLDRRQKLAEMVLTELPGDDPEELALRGVAEAVRDLCLSPGDPDVITPYLEVRRAHVDVLKSLIPPGTGSS